MYKGARIKRDLLKDGSNALFPSPCLLRCSLRDPAHNPMAIRRRRVNVTRGNNKVEPLGTRDLRRRSAPALHIKRPYPHGRHLRRRRGTRADCVNAAVNIKACRPCARTYFAIQRRGRATRESDAVRGPEFQSRAESRGLFRRPRNRFES